MVESLFVVFLSFFIVNLILVVWALIDTIKVPDDSMFKAGNKLIWVIVIVFTGFIGAILYLAVGRPRLAAEWPDLRPWWIRTSHGLRRAPSADAIPTIGR